MSSSLAEQLALKFALAKTEFQRVLADNCPVPVFVCDDAGAWIYTNTPMQLLLAAKSEELLNGGWQVHIEPKELPKTVARWQVLISSKRQISKCKIHYVSKLGDKGSAFAQTTRMPSGYFVGFVTPICEAPVNCPVNRLLTQGLELLGKDGGDNG